MSDELYKLALQQKAVSEQYGIQARQESSAEEAIRIISDYVRVTDELSQTVDVLRVTEEENNQLRDKVAHWTGKAGAAQRKINKFTGESIAQEKIISTLEAEVISQESIVGDQLDTIHELTAQLDARDVN